MRPNRPALFKGRHFEAEIIVLCVRWYLRFGLSFRNLEEMMAERNLHVDHVTIWRWVQRYAPELDRRCRRELRPTNGSWRVDETYLRVAGRWTYLYRAVDSAGATIDFLLSAKRDAAGKAVLPESLALARSPAPPSDQCGREPIVSEGDHRVKEEWRTGEPVPLPTRPIPEQHRGARPPRYQTTGPGQPGVPLLPISKADDSRHRDEEHDSEGTDKVVGRSNCLLCGQMHEFDAEQMSL